MAHFKINPKISVLMSYKLAQHFAFHRCEQLMLFGSNQIKPEELVCYKMFHSKLSKPVFTDSEIMSFVKVQCNSIEHEIDNIYSIYLPQLN
jgi:hypothetical protein